MGCLEDALATSLFTGDSSEMLSSGLPASPGKTLFSGIRALLTSVSVLRLHHHTHSLVPGPFPPPASREKVQKQRRARPGFRWRVKGCTCPFGLFRSWGHSGFAQGLLSALCCSGATPGGLTGPSVVLGIDPGQLCAGHCSRTVSPLQPCVFCLVGSMWRWSACVGWTAQRLAGPAPHRLVHVQPQTATAKGHWSPALL